jgi:zinc transport system substrate-binding protein
MSRSLTVPQSQFVAWGLRVSLFLLLLAAGWTIGSLLRNRHANVWPPRSGKVRVLTTIFPLYDFAREVGGSDVEVRNLLPPGVDPHEFALSPRDVALIEGADVLVANGAGLDDYLTKAIQKAQLTKRDVVVCTEGLPKQREAAGHADKDHEGEEGDPHLWLDPQFARWYVHNVAQEIVNEMIAHGDLEKAQAVKDRAAKYDTQLVTLDKEYRTRLGAVPNRAFIAFHGAYGYLAARYGLEVAAVWQSTPGREPSPREVGSILKVARDRKIRALFSEPQFSPRAIEMIAKDARLPVYTLDPLETAVDLQGTRYLTTMRRNLDTLVKALSGNGIRRGTERVK